MSEADLPPFDKLTDPVGVGYLGWRICAQKRPLPSGREREAWQDELGLHDLPEMLFGASFASFEHAASGFRLQFNAIDALRLVDLEKCDVQLSYAEKWTKSKIEAGESDKLVAGKAFDWTFSSAYAGSVLSGHVPHDTTEHVDLERLKQRDPILFYDEVILFEGACAAAARVCVSPTAQPDELADNGASMLSVKLRVMPTCFFALQRLFIRVDDVIFRVFDTRMYHEFGKPVVVRETQRRESTYASLGAALPRDRSKLNDANFMTPLIALQSTVVEAFDLMAAPVTIDAPTTTTTD